MPFEYRYASNPLALWAGMTATTALNDGSEGDTATGVQNVGSASVGAGVMCQFLSTSAPLIAEIRHDNRQSVTTWRVNGSVSVSLVNNQTVCTIDIENPLPSLGGTVEYALQYWDGAAWLEIDSFTLSLPGVGFAETQTLSVSSGSRPIAATVACDWRVIITCSYAVGVVMNTLSLTNSLTDFRLTSTDTGVACDYSAGGGDGEGGGSGGGGEETGCTCEWTTSGVSCSAAWEAGSVSCSTTWTKTGC